MHIENTRAISQPWLHFFFYGDTGSGNDDCYWDHHCDPHEVAPGYYPESANGDQCSYDPGANVPGTNKSCEQLFNTQSAACNAYCGPLTPNGCDCFGCCAVPDGADAVVMQEDVSIHGSRIHVRYAVRPGANIRHEGSDLRSDAVYLEKGTLLDAGAIALLASQDVALPEVRRRPVVAILPTGDELRAIGDPESYGSIVDSNAPMLAALVERARGLDPGRRRRERPARTPGTVRPEPAAAALRRRCQSARTT